MNNEEYAMQMEQMESALLKNARMYEDSEIRSRDESTKLMHKLQQAEVSLNTMRQDNNSLKKDNVELKNHIISLEQLLCVKEDVYSQLNSGLERLGNSQEDCDRLRGRLEAGEKVNESQEEKVFELEKCLIYLKNVIQDKDEYNLNLMKVILEMKEKTQVYIPTDDEIDLRLADFINGSNDPAKLTKLFLREGSGVYSFGSKKIYVKMESGKIFIRVGGGFLTLEQFLKDNCNIELEKMARRDPVNIFASNVAANQMLAGRSVKKNSEDKFTTLNYKGLTSEVREGNRG